ncbi:MAG: helix-turn-helix transcriptional regulator [Taibaiella sp.]|nr:helix-turn-helix transcriptional regulator [Taibaiella sp.]
MIKTAVVDLISPAVKRVIGEQAQVLLSQESSISQYIKAVWLNVAIGDNELPEDNGRLFLYPIEDGRFCLELIYVQENNDGTNAVVTTLRFLPGFFDQFAPETLMANQPFRFDQTTEQQFTICPQARMLLEQLNQTGATPMLQALQHTEAAMQLLRRALECITQPFTACHVPACRFLAYDTERTKIFDAARIIEEELSNPLTIKELSRRVAMNECYLKKGFKALIGKTIHEYQLNLRIARARALLQQQAHSVSEVADLLGYSSISHFSTAFKKATGLKPCELLK